MFYKLFKLTVCEILIISFFTLHISCIDTSNDSPENQDVINGEGSEAGTQGEQATTQDSERQATELEWANQQLKNTVCDDIPKLYSTSLNQGFNSNIYHNTDSPYICNSMACQCGYYTGSPSQWVVSINSSTEKSKEKLEEVLLKACQSHNPSFIIHSCSQR